MRNAKEIRAIPSKVKEIKKEEESELEKELEIESDNQFSNFMAGGEVIAPVLREAGIGGQAAEEQISPMQERRNVEPGFTKLYDVAENQMRTRGRQMEGASEIRAPILRQESVFAQQNQGVGPRESFSREDNTKYEDRVGIESVEIGKRKKNEDE